MRRKARWLAVDCGRVRHSGYKKLKSYTVDGGLAGLIQRAIRTAGHEWRRVSRVGRSEWWLVPVILLVLVGNVRYVIDFYPQTAWLSTAAAEGLVIAPAAVIGLLYVRRSMARSRSEAGRSPIQQRLSTLMQSLTLAVDLAAEIESEVAARQMELDRLRAESEVLAALSAVSKETAAAVALTIQGAVKHRSARDFIVNTLVAILLTAFTTAVAIVLAVTASSSH